MQRTTPDRIDRAGRAESALPQLAPQISARIDRGVALTLDGLAVFSMLAIGAAGLATCVDILLRNLAGGAIRGMVDLTQLAMMYSVFAAIAYGFGTRAHVAVSVLTDLMPHGIARAFAVLGWLAAVGLAGWLSYASFGQARLVMSYGDVSQNLKIPMWIYWLPVVLGLALSALAALWAVLGEAREGKDNEC